MDILKNPELNQINRNKEDTILYKLKQLYFNLCILMIKTGVSQNHLNSFWIIAELFQFLAFSFDSKFDSTWQSNQTFEQLSHFFSYFQLYDFIKGNQIYYYISFYGCLLVLLLWIVCVCYLLFALSRNSLSCLSLISILKIVSFHISNFLFLPFIQIFIAVLYYDSSTKKNLFIPNITVNSLMYYCQLIVGAFGIALLGVIAYSYKITMFNSNEQISTGFDCRILIAKTIFALSFALDKSNDQMFLMLNLFTISLYMAYYYNAIQPYCQGTTRRMYRISSYLFVWTNCVLVIGKLFIPMGFNGSLPLWMLGDFLVIMIVLFYSYDPLPLILSSIPHMTDSYELIRYIRDFNEIILSLDEKTGKSHANLIILMSYLKKYEEKCKVPNCPVSKYLNNTEPNNNGIVYLYQHIESLFDAGITRFPICAQIRRSFAEYLIQFNKKSNAIKELIIAEHLSPNLEEEFMIYRNKRALEDIDLIQNPTSQNTLFKNPKTKYEYSQQDNISLQLYKVKFGIFKNNLLKLSNLYNDFWGLLLDNHDIKEQLDKLNQLGTKINDSLKNINAEFDELRQMNSNDFKVLFYYSEFLSKVLNEKEKAVKYKEKYLALEEAKDSNEREDIGIVNLENFTLHTDDEQMYIVLSANKQSFGSIINVSLSTCAYFGYSRNDLQGKPIDILIPYLIKDEHKKMLHEKMDIFLKDKAINQIEQSAIKTRSKLINSFGITRAKYLIEIKIKTSMCALENHEYVFIARFEKNDMKSNSISNNAPETITKANPTCYILVDNNFIIQNFSSNVLAILGIKTSLIHTQVEVTSFIKEFHEEFLKRAVEVDSLTPEQKVLIKKDIIEKHYRLREQVTLRKMDVDSSSKKVNNLNETSDIFEDSKMLSTMKMFMKSEILMLTVKDFCICDRPRGYLFQFELWSGKLNVNRKSLTKETPRKSKVLSSLIGGLALNIGEETNAVSNANQEFQNELALLHGKVDEKRLFQLDPTKMSYVMNQALNPHEMREKLKKIALNKLNCVTLDNDKALSGNNNDESNEESYSLSSDENNQEQSSAISQSDSTENKESFINNADNHNVSLDTFYRVNLSNIKYSVYDFKKKMIVPSEIIEKQSQVDFRLNNDNVKEKTSNSLGTNNSIGQIESTNDPNNLIQSLQNKDKENTLIKHIKQALSKEDTQPSIKTLKLFTSISFFLLLANASIWLIDISISNSQIKQLFAFIQGSSNLLYISLGSLFNVQELIFLNHPNYTSYFYSKEKDIELLGNFSNDNYFQSHQIISNLSNLIGSLDKTTQTSLNNTFCNLKQLNQEDFSIQNYNLTVFSSLTQVNTALYHIINDKIEILPTNQLVFFYKFNSLNDVLNEQMNLITTYSSAFLDYLNYTSTTHIILFTIAIPFLVFIYLTVTKSFEVVIARKESYLEAFFQIGENVIQRSLEKCDKFIKEVQSENITKDISNDDEDDDYDGDNSFYQGNSQTQLLLANGKDGDKKGTHNRMSLFKKSKNASKETKMIKLLLAILSMVVLGINSVIVAFSITFIVSLKQYITVYNMQNKLQTYILLLLIEHREYFFDETQLVNNTNILTHLYQIRQIYYNQSAKNEESQHYPSEYLTALNEVYYSNMCTLLSNIPPANSHLDLFDCNVILYGAIKYGLDIVKETFLMDLRSLLNSKKFRVITYDKGMNFQYNLTLIGTSLAINSPPPGSNSDVSSLYYAMNPITLFNNERHRNIKLAYVFIIKSPFGYLFEKFSLAIVNVIQSNLVFLYSVIIAYLSLAVVMFVLVWKPFENRLKNVIYKTKNMLSIIPIDVLASFDKIHQLLGIKQDSANGKGDLKVRVN